MGAQVADLPPGFKLDDLPPGFTLDAPGAPRAAAPQPGVPRAIAAPQAQAMTRPGWKPEPAAREVGGLEAMLRTVGEAARVAVGQATMANAALARVFGQSAQDAAFRTHEQIQESMRGAYAPKPNERFGVLPSLAGGIVSAPIEVVGGMGMQHGTERAQEVMQRGGTLAEAQRAGGVTGAVRTAMNLLPAKAGGAVGRAIESKVGGAIGGAATGGTIAAASTPVGRAAENAALPEGEQFQDLRRSVAPSAAEIGMGMAFGAVPGAAAAGGAALKARKAKAAALERPELEGVRVAAENGFWLTPAAAKAGLAQRGTAVVAGRRETAKKMAEHNEANAARLVREDVGLPADAPITRDALVAIREQEGQAYDALRRFGEFETDPKLKRDIDDVVGETRGLAEEFPTLLDSPLLDHAAALDVPRMTTSGAIAVVRDLRNKADKASKGEKPDFALARAYRTLAETVDSAMDRGLSRRAAAEGPEAQQALDAYRAARVRIAKAHMAEDALTGIPGVVDTVVYGKALEKSPDKLTGPSKVLGQFHNQFAQQGLAKVDRKPPSDNLPFSMKWLALIDVPLTAARAVVRAPLLTEGGQKAITGRARAATEPGPPAPPPPAPPGLELSPEGPLPPRPAGEAPAAPLGDLTPDWETAPGAAPAAPRAEVMSPEGLVPAIDSMEGPARVQPGGYDPRPSRNFSDAGPVRPGPAAPAPELPRGVRPVAEEIPAVPGRPDLPDAMVAGPPAELAPTEAVGAAMQEPTTALARRQQEAARLAAETQSPEVQRVLAEHAKKLERQAAAEAAKQKRLQDAAELRRVAAQTADPEIQQALHARAATLEAAEPVPAGKAKELDAAPAAKPAKEPAKPLPAGEVTEIAAEVVEPAPVAAKPEPVTPPKRTEPRFDPTTAQLADDPDAGALGKWMLANARGASARTRKEAAEGIVAAFKGSAPPDDAVREILRASAKVLPQAARRGLRKAMGKGAAKADEAEFWADNAAKILNEKFTGRGSWRASARKWLRQASAEAVRVAGVRADDPALTALEKLLQERT